MFARQAFRSLRSSAPLKSIRTYADTPPSGGGGLGAAGWSAIAIVGAGSAYYGYRQLNAPTSKDVVPKGSLNKKEPAPVQFKGGEQGFVSLKLDSIENINNNTKKFHFAFEDPAMESGLPVASAVVTKYQGPEMDKPVIRPYTPTSDEDTQGYMDFVIKRYPNGPMSEHIHNMAPGQRLDIKGPIPKYPMTPNKHNHIAMIAGGTGITPMYQVMRNIFKNPEDKTQVTLLFGNLTEDDILLKKELAELENTYPRRFRTVYTLNTPPEGSPREKGVITKEILKAALPEPKEENIKIFVCGPPGLYKAISGTKNSPTDQGELSGALKDLGYSPDQVYKF